MRRAREVLAGGDADNVVAYLLNEPLDNVKRVTGVSSLANRQSRINRAELAGHQLKQIAN